MPYAWFIWSLILLGIWSVTYLALRDPDGRREMLVTSAITSLFGLTEPVFVPAYWLPPSLFDLAAKTRFDIESLLFSFGIGGLAVALYEVVLPGRHAAVLEHERAHRRHRLHVWAVASGPVAFGMLYVATPLNPIYSATLAFVMGGAFTAYCRPDLVVRMVASGGIFLALYFVYFWTLTLAFPAYVALVWNLPALSGVLVAGVPAEELLFAATFGFMWSSTYEHVAWRRHTLGRHQSG